MKKTCYIVGAGDISNTTIRIPDGAFVISADGGYGYLKNIGITPDVAVGDFDSLGYMPCDTETEQKHRFLCPAEEAGHQIFSAVIQCGQDLRLLGTVYLIVPAQINDQRQQGGCMVTNAGNFLQFLRVRFQHLCQTAEMLQQTVGNGIGIGSGNGIEQQQLQNLNICEVVKSFFQKPLLQPLPVAFVDGFLRHSITKNLSCYFRIFPLE